MFGIFSCYCYMTIWIVIAQYLITPMLDCMQRAIRRDIDAIRMTSSFFGSLRYIIYTLYRVFDYKWFNLNWYHELHKQSSDVWFCYCGRIMVDVFCIKISSVCIKYFVFYENLNWECLFTQNTNSLLLFYDTYFSICSHF